jgi:predicted ATPase
VAYAQAIDHRLSLANVLAEAACPIALLEGDFDLADHYIGLLHEQTKTQALDVWNTYAECFRGESLVGRGAHADGIAALQSGLNRLRRGGFLLFESTFLAAIARGYLATRDASGGLACVDLALKNCEASGEGWCLAELIRLRGELSLLEDGLDPMVRPDQSFPQSMKLSSEQGAFAWELRGTVSCAKFYAQQGRATEAKALLEGVIGLGAKKGDSSDLKAANSLLALL